MDELSASTLESDPSSSSFIDPGPGIGSPPGAATAVGSWPGSDGADVLAATRAVFDDFGEPPHLPYLPEVPGRGPGADLIGRGATLLVDLPVDLQPSGWRLVDHPGRDLNRAGAFVRQDLDILAEAADGYDGRLKLQVTGPWTLAAALRLPRLERAVVDPGAVRDLIASLAEGVSRHVHEVRRVVPGAAVVVQIDEPALAAVMTGALPTASGFGRLRAVEEPVVVEGLRVVLDAVVEAGAVGTVLHSCAADVPVPTLARTGVGALSLDIGLLGVKGWEQVAEAVEAGTQLWAGAVDTSPAALAGPLPRPDVVTDRLWTAWGRLGLDPSSAGAVVITPACGLAGASPTVARQVHRLVRRAAEVLAERADGG